jgi:DNA-binding NarL/FixJ family response regulator
MDKHPFIIIKKESVRLILKGKSYKDIEGELFISVRTVRNHVSNIYRKFMVKNRFKLINLL